MVSWGSKGQHPNRKEKGAAKGSCSPSWRWCSGGGARCPQGPFREAIPRSLGDVRSWWWVLLQGGVHGEPVMLGGLVFCGVSELAVLGDLQPGWGGRGWGGQAVPRGCQRHTRVCWTQGGKLPLLQSCYIS